MPDRRRFDPFQQIHAYLHNRRTSPGRRKTDQSFTIGCVRLRAPDKAKMRRARAANDPKFHRRPFRYRIGAITRTNLRILRTVLCQLAGAAARAASSIPMRLPALVRTLLDGAKTNTPPQRARFCRSFYNHFGYFDSLTT